jgi:hypothetical protein
VLQTSPEPLIRDLVRWVAEAPRPYVEVMEAWRTSCPRMTVWEDAIDAGLVRVEFRGAEKVVNATGAGRAFLREAGESA